MTKGLIAALLGVLFLVSPVTAQNNDSMGEVDVVEADVTATDKGVVESFKVFTDQWAREDHYIPSGWMGDYGDIRINDGCKVNPYSGKTCIEIKYSARKSNGAGWMGIFWQNPPNNWGDQMGGYDLTGYKKLKFFARGEKGGEVIQEFKIGGINGTYADSDSTSIGPVTLGDEWEEFEIDLRGLDLSYISGGFGMSASSINNPNGFTIYLDDIRYEK